MDCLPNGSFIRAPYYIFIDSIQSHWNSLSAEFHTAVQFRFSRHMIETSSDCIKNLINDIGTNTSSCEDMDSSVCFLNKICKQCFSFLTIRLLARSKNCVDTKLTGLF